MLGCAAGSRKPAFAASFGNSFRAEDSASLPWLSFQSQTSQSSRAKPERVAPGSPDAEINRLIVSDPKWRSPICMPKQ